LTPAGPFHSSTSVSPRSELPTAVQADGDAQAVLFRTLKFDPGGLGVVWICQLVPFHRSASVTGVPLLRG
jgi:hypothetical protein